MSLPLASAPSAYWYATRGAGVVALLLLTASLVMGVVDLSRWQSERWPRFLLDGLHRTLSLLAVAVVAIHVLTTVADGFTSIGLKDSVIPFAATYRRLWLGFGTLAFDLLLAVAVTSVLRRRFGHRAWRAVHWAAYACWPLALIHGLGSGTDTPLPWMLLLSAGCLLAVLVAVGWRVATAWPDDVGRRTLAAAFGAAGLAGARALGRGGAPGTELGQPSRHARHAPGQRWSRRRHWRFGPRRGYVRAADSVLGPPRRRRAPACCNGLGSGGDRHPCLPSRGCQRGAWRSRSTVNP